MDVIILVVYVSNPIDCMDYSRLKNTTVCLFFIISLFIDLLFFLFSNMKLLMQKLSLLRKVSILGPNVTLEMVSFRRPLNYNQA